MFLVVFALICTPFNFFYSDKNQDILSQIKIWRINIKYQK